MCNVYNNTMKNCTKFCLFLLSFNVVSIYCQYIFNQVDEVKILDDSFPLVQKYLNDDVEAKFAYNSGKVTHSQWKGDILEVDTEFSISCETPNAEECKFTKAECKGLIYASPKSGTQILSVDCTPSVEPKIAAENSNLVGGMRDLDVNAEGVENLVRTVLNHVESEKHKEYHLLEVLRVQHQVIFGYNTFVTLKIADSTGGGILTCFVKFYKKPGRGKVDVIKSNNCTESQEFTPPKTDENLNKIEQNESENRDPLFDLMTQIIANKKEKIESSSIHNLVDENGQPLVISSTFQEVVATEDEPISLGTDTANVEVTQQSQNAPTSLDDPDKILIRKIRAENLIGGKRPMKLDDPKIDTFLKLSINHLNSLGNNEDDKNNYQLSKVLSATSQVVAGISYDIKVELANNKCQIEINSVANCPDSKQICDIHVWSRPWLKSEITDVKCGEMKTSFNIFQEEKPRTKRKLVGGFHDVDAKDERIQKHLNNILPKLEQSSGGSNGLKVIEIVSAQSQVVAGTNWVIKAKISTGNNPTICTFKFWEKLPDKQGVRQLENLQVNCEDSKVKLARSKREIDENDLIYEYLTKSLQHIDLNSPEEYRYKIKEIISVDRLGDLAIKASLILSDCEKNDVTDWDQCGELQGVEPKICLINVRENHIKISCEKQKYEYSFRTKRSLKHLQEFEDFMKAHKKIYRNPKELAYRFSVFEENMKFVTLLNEHEKGTATYGATQFADLTREEFQNHMGYRPNLKHDNDLSFSSAEIPNVTLPDSFDWRTKNAVTKVKNQGSCGSCWAFSVTGNVEGQYAIQNNKLLEFSEQELVDCDTADQGCNGGLMDNAYRQIEKLGGLETESDYPYEAENEKCHFKKSLVQVELSGAVNISTNEVDMAKWLVKNGPISIAINANAMQFYMGGVSHPWKFLCNPKSLDHGVLIVGYGVDTFPKFKKTMPYWIVKNSWGESWGEQGYYRVYRGDGVCGVNQTPSSAILK